MRCWNGRVDEADGPRALRWHQKVTPATAGAPPGIALLGFACDEGVRRNRGRAGAAQGPQVLRMALANMAWHQGCPIYDAGDVLCRNGNLEAAQAELAEAVAALVAAGHRPLILGGGHETAWGTFQGLTAVQANRTIGVINFDAHLDLRGDQPGNSGTSFAQIARRCQETGRDFRYLCLGVSQAANTIALLDRAKSLGAELVFDRDLVAGQLESIAQRLSAFVQRLDQVHLSIDLDVLPANAMPAVSAPAGRGVPLELVESLLSAVLSLGKIAAVDLVEFNPSLDRDGCAARVAARLAWQIAMEWRREETTA
jgi:formiminoglutamase